MTRRSFLQRAVKAFFLVAAVTASIAGLLFAYPVRLREGRTVFFELLKEDDLPRIGVRKVDFTYTSQGRDMRASTYLVARDGQLYALSPVCTHLGCLVSYQRRKNIFLCPCHGGEYDVTGKVLAGPPLKPLAHMPLEVKDGMVFIGMRV